MSDLTTFIIPSIHRPTLQRAIDSVGISPFLVGFDDGNRGPAAIRNDLIEQAQTPWVSMLDDDDTVTSDYLQRLEEELAVHTDAEVVIFREYFLWGQVLPKYPTVGWGNIGISFSVRRDVALTMPFKDERYEDFEFIHRLDKAGKKIIFSDYLTYRARH